MEFCISIRKTIDVFVRPGTLVQVCYGLCDLLSLQPLTRDFLTRFNFSPIFSVVQFRLLLNNFINIVQKYRSLK